MQQEAVAVVREYTEAVFRRAQVPMEPFNFEVDWVDQPSRHLSYPGAPRLPLPTAVPDLATLRDLVTGENLPPVRGWSLDRLATLLRLSYGVLDRRMTVNWNQDAAKRAHFEHAVWGRGTASGGGMYPVEIYLVAGASSPLLPGVYHYHTGQHVLERLLVADVADTVRTALGDAASPDGPAAEDSFLLATLRFWKNSFKYNSFCYHVVTQDLGAMLGSWDLLAPALGGPLRRHLRFDPAPLDRLLGFDSDAQSVFTVVPVRWTDDGRPAPTAAPAARSATTSAASAASQAGPSTAPAAILSRPAGSPADGPRVRHEPFERSQRVLEFPQVTTVHRAAVHSAPTPGRVADAAPVDLPGDPVALPAPQIDRLAQPLSTVLASRNSSFGRFRRPPELTAAELGTTLAFAAAGGHHPADVKGPDGGPALTRLWVFANHVDGLDTGSYAYCGRQHALLPAGPEPEGGMSAFLQQQYFLTNYTMSQVGAVLAISGRPDAVLDVFGPRGYRVLNAEIGTIAQRAYLSATAQRLGCGAVLGFDNVAMNTALGLDDTDERTVLFLLLGRHPEATADLAYRL
ncbi:SagB-type dehydrogenase domain-containing protein [Micromonospora pallida]|uniref:SagB-type dehydrogenase domain-containing protein n=1 Tax=Micromonospora pallida TaxID=145854 RepID=A0A1C6RQB1_9ACTN|nr:SagB family peptide dehydrogenase [Micromonospora pallida]SCL19406.1 SagB-type dehydrogenase domain-containing protein [Micromonospora pallida]